MDGKMQSAKKIEVCLKPDCGRQVHCLGVCARCYSRMAYSVKKGLTTWAKLASAGMVLKSNGRGRKNSTLIELKRRNTVANQNKVAAKNSK